MSGWMSTVASGFLILCNIILHHQCSSTSEWMLSTQHILPGSFSWASHTMNSFIPSPCQNMFTKYLHFHHFWILVPICIIPSTCWLAFDHQVLHQASEAIDDHLPLDWLDRIHYNTNSTRVQLLETLLCVDILRISRSDTGVAFIWNIKSKSLERLQNKNLSLWFIGCSPIVDS